MHASILGWTQSPLAAPGPDREPLLPLCQLSLPMADLLARAEATGTFVKVYLKHVVVLAWFQGSDDRPPQFVCAMLQSKPRKQQKEANSQTAPNIYVETPPTEEGKRQPCACWLCPFSLGSGTHTPPSSSDSQYGACQRRAGPGVPIPFFPSLPDGKGG